MPSAAVVLQPEDISPKVDNSREEELQLVRGARITQAKVREFTPQEAAAMREAYFQNLMVALIHSSDGGCLDPIEVSRILSAGEEEIPIAIEMALKLGVEIDPVLIKTFR